MIVQSVDGLPVRLRAPYDLTILRRWGRVFTVFDDQDSGNLCFGVRSADGPVFVKLAGASTVRYEGEPRDAVDRLRRAAEVYRALAHPNLIELREAVDVPNGCVLVFSWSDGVPLGRQYDRRAQFTGLEVDRRADAVQQLLDFHVEACARGWVAIDLYDGSVLLDPVTGAVTLCDLDFYRRVPVTNTMGRMWGSTRFMSPEEFILGEEIDELSTVFTLGALAHALLGDDSTKHRIAWTGSEAQFQVAARALQPRRQDRWPSLEIMAAAWRSASLRTSR